MSQSICLGCGATYCDDAQRECWSCTLKTAQWATDYKHWPLETSLSSQALAHVARALRDYNAQHLTELDTPLLIELGNTANRIESYFQHADSRHRAAAEPAIDPLLL